MKKAEQILGIISTSLLVLGIVFKLFHLPGAGPLVFFGVLLFNFAYLPVQLIHRRINIENRLQAYYNIARFITLFIVFSSFIFRLMQWPGASISLYSSLILIPGFIAFYFIMRAKKLSALPFILDDFLLTCIFFGIFLILNLSRIPTDVTGGYRLMEEQYLKQNAALLSSNQMIYESLIIAMPKEQDSLDIAIRELWELGQHYKRNNDSLKKGLYTLVLNMEETGLENLPDRELASFKPVESYFIQGGKAEELKKLLEHYGKGIHELALRFNIQSASAGSLIGTEDIIKANGQSTTWINYYFDNVPLGSALISMSLFEQMVLITENMGLKRLMNLDNLTNEAKIIQELAARESDQAMKFKETEITRMKQQKELQAAQLEASRAETEQNRMMAIFGLVGIIFVLLLLSITTRAYYRKQMANKKLALQKNEISEQNEELNQQNEEIAAQRDEIEAQRDLVFKQKEQIEKAHTEVSSSIDYAVKLQASILPSSQLIKENFDDHFIFFRPRDRVSGDFYWWTKVNEKIIITAADCTGHGVPGAIMSMMGVSLLREVVNKDFETRPEIILNRLRKEVIRTLDQKGDITEQKDGMELALISIDPHSMICQYAGAGNPLYLIRDGELTEYKADLMPVSYYDRMDQYTQHEFQLRKGDRLYLFSDGFADQFGEKEHKKFKAGAFKRLLLENADLSMKAQKRALEQSMNQWQGESEQIDDMLILALRI